MERKIIYITTSQCLEIQSQIIDKSGGSDLGVLNEGQIESVINNIQNDDYYPMFVDKLTHLFFSINKFHCFTDGNKRSSIAISMMFLIYNGYSTIVTAFAHTFENIAVSVAKGTIEKEFLREIFSAFLNGDLEENEHIKLELISVLIKEQAE